ncbi:YpmS family protein [Lacticaseibacillus thailandensis]|uniref:DUF2140 family protein n=1 Tax=Lacticaseibacillus thailandensis DSM 22698 = JCM 13996 TaxID=1423810 RepID=A0A0R2C9K2_9LACO|nr:YpmS family protein [Lacticaseibacillus thailandensis]KRM88058.1 hypothetical protein FD19_GL000342 [Lacticaseibacillus thailandensis DSM 22698 = JCM 13996]
MANNEHTPKQASRREHNRAQTAATTSTKPRRHISWWFWAFIVLLGLVVGASGTLVYKASRPVETTTAVKPVKSAGDVMHVSMTKKEVNRLIATYLSHQLKAGDVKYSFSVGNHAVLKGTFKFFGTQVHFGMVLDPYVQTNGNVLLKVTQINVGKLGVPVSYVMSYVANNYKLPGMVEVNTKRKMIVLRLNKLKLGNGLRVRADRIDLVHDEIDVTGYTVKAAK